jgi:predicted outer membrane repeat protein
LHSITNCTFNKNLADSGGALYSSYDPFTPPQPSLINCILWGDSPPEILMSSGNANVIYTNIDNGWPGIGNISLDPSFVDTTHDDYRLLWGSPCIDAGHPDSLDPDGTRADMGAFYYDQSKPVRILLTPHEIPFLIPDSGGTMTYTLRLDTHLEEPQIATFWCDVTLPDSSILGPLLGPATVDVYPNQMVSWVRYQGVPESAPLGVSHYNAYAVVGDDTSKDSFMFGVMGFGSDIQDPWPNWGDPLGVPPAPLLQPGIPEKFALHPPHPNPFNSMTAISFQLSANSYVSLQVYDTAGRLMTILIDGWQAAGMHEAVFDGTDWPSGIYLCRMQAGEFEAVQKMVLLK